MDLNSLARTLAERLTLDVAELPDRTSPDDWPEAMLITDSELREMAEAVIREAIEKTIEEAESLAELRGECAEIGGLLHNLNEQYKRGVIDSARQIQDAIRSLKQSNSGNQRIGNQHHQACTNKNMRLPVTRCSQCGAQSNSEMEVRK